MDTSFTAEADLRPAPGAGLSDVVLGFALSREGEVKRYGYRVGSLGFLTGEKTRSEVVRVPVVSTIPHAPAWLLGVMNLRGNLVPVMDLAGLCGDSSDTRTLATVLVLDVGEKAVAIPVASLPRPVNGLRPLATDLPLPETIAPHAGPFFEADDGVWFAFDHEQFFRALARGPGVQP